MSSRSAESPTTIGRYVVEGQLGRGAMGIVFRGRDPRIDRPVALKTLDPAAVAQADDESVLKQRFLNEGRAAGRLNHPGIVALYDADEDPVTGMAYLAMELVEGTDLKKLMAEGLGRERLLRIVGEVADALDHAHERGVIHRDVKPANILIGTDGRARLSDFGIARLGSSTMTQTGQFIGTPAYMSPEQVRARPVTRASDIFSLGVVLYEGLTGRKPFAGDSVVSTTHAIANDAPRRPTEIAPSLSPAFDAVLGKALAKEPNERYETAGALARAAVDAAVAPAPWPAAPVEVAAPPSAAPDAKGASRWSDRWPLLLAAAGVVVLAFVGWRLARSGASSADTDAPAVTIRRPTDRASGQGTRRSSDPSPRTSSRTGAVPAPAPADARLAVDLFTFFSGTLIVRAGDRELGRTAVQDLGRDSFKMRNPKRHFTSTLSIPAGRQTLSFTFERPGKRPLARSVQRDVAPGQALHATIDIGTLGREMDVRVQ